jgi:coenzyme F390 synthetase-like protein
MLNFKIKKIIQNVPYPIGHLLAMVPFSFRFGQVYSKYIDRIKILEYEEANREAFIIENFSTIFEFAKQHYPFYQNLYKNAGVYDLKIECLNDIKKLPVITKSMIREHLCEFKGAMLLNTGGTTGEPFAFYVDKYAYAREWAHMHMIWKLKNYEYTDLKLTLRGRNLGNKNFVYNPIHNEYVMNTYKSVSLIKNELLCLFRTKKIKYLHGYPSTIFEFLKGIENSFVRQEREIIRKNLVACLLASEFPHPNITEYFTKVWNLDYISWYGHSEMCVLAYDESKDNKYKPFISYGYPEVVDNNLIGTSYHNFDMPLIRYNTGDIVKGFWNEKGILEYFSITEGRNADYITDLDGNRIALTALIFGRHHKAFNLVNFVQVEQKDNGKVIFYLVIEDNNILNSAELLDLSNVNIDYEIKIINSPFKTKAGKLKLKI